MKKRLHGAVDAVKNDGYRENCEQNGNGSNAFFVISGPVMTGGSFSVHGCKI